MLQDTTSEEGVAKRGSSKNVIAIIATEVAAVEAAVAVGPAATIEFEMA